VIGDDDTRAGTWTVWTSKNNLDVYMTARSLAGTWKASLHASGSWQHGLTTEAAARYGRQGPSRHIEIWDAPEEFGPGARRSITVLVPDSELREWPPGASEAGDVVAIPRPGDEHATLIELVFMASQPPMALTLADPVFDVASLIRADGNLVRVIARQIPWGLTDQTWLAAHKTSILPSVDPVWLRRAQAPRLVLMGAHEDGTRFVVDAAAR